MKFYKYQGTGNDFIMIDNREQKFSSSAHLVQKLCDRRFGIGADGLILLENSNEHDFKMVYFNSDGNPSTMCGNGGRCIVAFAKQLGIISNKATFEAIDGVHCAKIENDEVSLEMISVNDVMKNGNDYVLNTGSPHYVAFVEQDIEEYPVYQQGFSIRNSEPFKQEGINVNFVSIKGEGIFVRTYERGVEDETLSCGTGVTAAAIATYLKTNKNPTLIQTLGGNLKVSFEANSNHSFTNVWLIGPATLVFEGLINISQ